MRLALFASALALAGCDQIAQQTTSTAEYSPEDAGSVDHAMCLLGFAGVPLTELSTGHHLVTLQLNGREAVFILDTGANATVLHAPHAERFGVGPGSVMPGVAVGLGGSMRARQAPIESMTIGDIPIRRNRIMLSDLAQIEQVLGRLSGRTISGIVGQDVMKEHRAVIDVAKPLLYLIEADEDPAPIEAPRCRDGAGARENGAANGSAGAATDS
ncbi:MAG: TIGR02281 family clan AA aspartic protease [Allosphingosinicella sp.]